MIKQLLCWLKTGHKKRTLVNSRLLPEPNEGFTDFTISPKIVRLERTYKCRDCGKPLIQVTHI
jgi:hypothetical protein